MSIFILNDDQLYLLVAGLSNLMRIRALDPQKSDGNSDSESIEDGSDGHGTDKTFAKSNRGMFAGIMLLAGSIISSVLFLFQVGIYPYVCEKPQCSQFSPLSSSYKVSYSFSLILDWGEKVVCERFRIYKSKYLLKKH